MTEEKHFVPYDRSAGAGSKLIVGEPGGVIVDSIEETSRSQRIAAIEFEQTAVQAVSPASRVINHKRSVCE